MMVAGGINDCGALTSPNRLIVHITWSHGMVTSEHRCFGSHSSVQARITPHSLTLVTL